MSLKTHMKQAQGKELHVIVCSGRIGKCSEHKSPSLRDAVHFKVQKYLKGKNELGIPLECFFTCKQSPREYYPAFNSQTHRSHCNCSKITVQAGGRTW